MTTITILSGATATITVAGTFETYPSFVVSGVIDLSNGSYRMATTPNALASGTVLNMKARTLMSGATNSYNKITPESMWWALQPGINVIHNNGSGTVVMTYHSAWL